MDDVVVVKVQGVLTLSDGSMRGFDFYTPLDGFPEGSIDLTDRHGISDLDSYLSDFCADMQDAVAERMGVYDDQA